MTDIPGVTGDTDPENPVNNYPADVFPLGAALTIAYGSLERPFCTIGNLYRILGHLTGDVPPADGQAADPTADPPRPYIAGMADEIARCRDHVLEQLPAALRTIDPPPAPADDGGTADLAWLGGVTNVYGTTITIRPMPNGDNDA